LHFLSKKVLPMLPSLAVVFILFVIFTSSALSIESSPRVWIFTGHPGDDEHKARFEGIELRLAKVLEAHYGLKQDRCHTFSGRALTREKIENELRKVGKAMREPGPIWVFFLGHANNTGRGANYNLYGPDISARRIGHMLADATGPAPLAVFFTTTASGSFIPPLAGPGRVVVTATRKKKQINETYFPDAMLEALEDSSTDKDKDGMVSVLEIYQATNQRVKEHYEFEELSRTETALLDGNGDGKGTFKPASRDSAGAALMRLRMKGFQDAATDIR
jgi:hypothetical protein